MNKRELRAAQAEAVRASRVHISPRVQAISVVVASGLSAGFAFISQIALINKIYPIPNWGWLVCIAATAAGLLIFMFIDTQSFRSMFEHALEDQLSTTEPSPALQRAGERVQQILLYAICLLCIVSLGWITLGTGGTLRSPFSAALLAIALLSPYVAVQWRTIVVVAGAVAITFLVCSELVLPDLDLGLDLGPRLLLVNTAATTVVALAFPIIRGFRAEQRVKRSVLARHASAGNAEA